MPGAIGPNDDYLLNFRITKAEMQSQLVSSSNAGTVNDILKLGLSIICHEADPRSNTVLIHRLASIKLNSEPLIARPFRGTISV